MLTITISSIMLTASQPFSLAIKMAGSLWGPYVVVTPLVYALCLRWPINGATWRKTLWLHLFASVICIAACEAAFVWISPVLSPPGPGSDGPPSVQSPPRFESGGRPDAGKNLPFKPNLRMTFFKAQFGLPLYWMLVALVHALHATSHLQEKERQAAEMAAHLTKAQLAGLRTQLQPHFLFNTMNSISALISHDPQMANSMLMNLSDLLRMSLRDPERGEITLGEELEFVRLYIDIQKLRFGARLNVVQDVDPSTLDLLVPPMLLQPIVENAIRYGIEPADQPETITLHCRCEKKWLVLVVTNTSSHNAEEITGTHSSTGLGLNNTRGRLKALYGEQQSFSAQPLSGGGFRVSIQLPAEAPQKHRTYDNQNHIG